MGGNDTYDKNGRPYELDDSKEELYARLEELREEVDSFHCFLLNLMNEYGHPESSMTIEFATTREILEEFEKRF